jgi:hypothetical protein
MFCSALPVEESWQGTLAFRENWASGAVAFSLYAVLVSRIRMKTTRSTGIAGKVFASFVLLIFFGMGLLFCGFILREFHLNGRTYRWSRTDCVILESRVDQEPKDENPYRFFVRYEYQWQGTAHISENYQRRAAAFSDYGKANRLVESYRADTKAVCFVNPSNSSEAILKRPSLWFGLAIVLPLIFVAIGGFGMVAVWRPSRPIEAAAESGTKPISSRAKSPVGSRLAITFFGFFFLIGAALFYFIALRPLFDAIAARDWTPTTCTILSSEVRSHRSDDSTTYRVDILYAYEVNGREYRSNRYQFMGGSSSGRKGKAEIVRRHRPGTQTTCYVNPGNPTDAVLQRGLTPGMWFGLIPLAFMLVGAGGVIGMLRKKRRIAADSSSFEPVSNREVTGSGSGTFAAPSIFDDASGPLVLKPSSSRIGGLVVTMIFAAIWNGFLFFGFLRESGVFRPGRTGAFDWIHLVFMVPFLAVGLALIGAVIYQVLALFNPKAEITISPRRPALGDRLDLSWHLTGRTHVLKSLEIFLEAREEATYRRGTSTSTDTKTFLKLVGASLENPAEMSAGRVQITVPADTVPSFKSDHNRVIWSIHVRGAIPLWPDLKEEFVIQVQPPARIEPT